MGGRKDLGGGEHAHAGGIQQVPAAHLLEQAAAVQGGQHVPPGQDHGGYPGERFAGLFWFMILVLDHWVWAYQLKT